ncbi:BT4734/BF3469 family protein [Paludibacter sp.]|uniref:BT4734/BF3469 family protein n=1 Tax=Paludibacter sp. TaxID=1898105 RepID=UPI0025D8C40E|nr:BT4734/BF3469 family protein [Paludibacter sp.]
MKKITVSVFQSYKTTVPSRSINIWEWLFLSNNNNSIVDMIRSTTDENERKRLKSSLPAITPSGIFSERRANKLIAHSGLICIDIDGKDNPNIMDMGALKKELSSNDHILYCGLSVSGNGLFCLVPIAYPEQHKGHFYALQKDFKDMGIVIDGGCSDVSRLRGYSYDENPHVNPEALLYEKTMEGSIKVSHINNSERTTQKQQAMQQSQPIQPIVPNDPRSLKMALFKPTNLDTIKVKTETISKIQKVRLLINHVIEGKIDITEKYGDWVKICCYLKNHFEKEEGRALFHKVSSFYSRYTYEETDEKFRSIQKGTYRPNSETLLEIASRYGVEIEFE